MFLEQFPVRIFSRDRGVVVAAVQNHGIRLVRPSFMPQEMNNLFAGVAGNGGIDQFDVGFSGQIELKKMTQQFSESLFSGDEPQAYGGGISEQENSELIAGFLYGQFIAEEMAGVGFYQRIVEIGAETPEKIRVRFVPVEKAAEKRGLPSMVGLERESVSAGLKFD